MKSIETRWNRFLLYQGKCQGNPAREARRRKIWGPFLLHKGKYKGCVCGFNPGELFGASRGGKESKSRSASSMGRTDRDDSHSPYCVCKWGQLLPNRDLPHNWRTINHMVDSKGFADCRVEALHLPMEPFMLAT